MQNGQTSCTFQTQMQNKIKLHPKNLLDFLKKKLYFEVDAD